MADEDDLDAFFDEVSEVEAKAAEEVDDTGKAAESGVDAKNTEAKTSTFEPANTEDEPPAKRIKTNAVIRPRGVVVAASTSVVMPAEERERKEAQLEAASNEAANANSSSAYNRAGPSTLNANIGPAVPATNPAGTNLPGAANNKKKGKKKR